MTKRRSRLGEYVASRKQKYTNPSTIFCHVSKSPRRVLKPKTTDYVFFLDGQARLDRLPKYVYLSKPGDVSMWIPWVFYSKFRAKTREQLIDCGGTFTVWIHFVRIEEEEELFVPSTRFGNEFVYPGALPVISHVPVKCRLKSFVPIFDMAKVWSRYNPLTDH